MTHAESKMLVKILAYENSRVFKDNHDFLDDGLFQNTVLAENLTFLYYWCYFMVSLCDHYGAIQVHFKVSLTTSRRLFGRTFLCRQIWSGMIGAPCRSCFVSFPRHFDNFPRFYWWFSSPSLLSPQGGLSYMIKELREKKDEAEKRGKRSEAATALSRAQGAESSERIHAAEARAKEGHRLFFMLSPLRG